MLLSLRSVDSCPSNMGWFATKLSIVFWIVTKSAPNFLCSLYRVLQEASMGWWIVVLVSLMSSPNVVLAQGNKAKAGPETATPDGAQSQDVSTITPNPPPLGSLVHVRLTSGDGLRGILVAQARDTVVIELPSAGRIELQRSAITSLSLANRTRIGPEGQLYRRDPNRTRYLWPIAFSLEAGEGYVSQKELLFTAVAYGVTDNITVLGGTIFRRP